MMINADSRAMGPVQPWWRIRMVWLAFGGPAVVVVGCFATLFFAVHGGDPPIARLGGPVPAGADVPAVQARNHVVTPAR